tara:strand:- start:3347 stop:4282 length:936 start_codon:yes stop_codon:yes gene_type:complete
LAILFSSGGGRLGNQILNLIHLKAISLGYELKVEKLNDNFIHSKKLALKFEIQDNLITWKIRNKLLKFSSLNKFLLKGYVILIHMFYYINPFAKSYIIGSLKNHPKYLLGDYLGNNFSTDEILKKAKKMNIVLSGWGLRDWKLVFKYKNKIVNHFIKALDQDGYIKKNIVSEKYLFLHIRRSDFLEVKEFKDINFSDQIWMNSILKLCSKKGLKKVIIFSDSILSNQFIESLEKNGIKTKTPLENDRNNFLKLFIKYISNASQVMCNASTLSLSLAFLFHEKVYLPSLRNDFQQISFKDAHKVYPTCITWK